jgi:hypothetical protein
MWPGRLNGILELAEDFLNSLSVNVKKVAIDEFTHRPFLLIDDLDGTHRPTRVSTRLFFESEAAASIRTRGKYGGRERNPDIGSREDRGITRARREGGAEE